MPGLNNIAFDPLVATSFIWLLMGTGLIAALMGGIARLRSFFFRSCAVLFLCLALLNPQTVEEDKEPLKDEVLIIIDQSESAQLGQRADMIDKIYQALKAKIANIDNIDITTVTTTTESNGTQLTRTMIESLSNLPQNRLAAIIAVTDGQVHDMPEQVEGLLPEHVPFHAIIIDDKESRDRRISTILAPRFALVGEQVDFEVRIDDPGHEGEKAIIQIRINGVLTARFPATIGKRVSLPVKIARRGINTIELKVAAAENELTLKNNIFVSEISGIRDHMQVLLITGEPHMGGRAWRNLLKSDPSVEMVHFTILTVPGIKARTAKTDELSLIAFPVQQLFEEKLEEFDLIIFDQFTRRKASGRSGAARAILNPYYIQNIATYVENGGALLIATGPGFASENSLYRSALAGILPVRPTGEVTEYAFRPQLTSKGQRHPVTASFSGQEDHNWGQWFRIVESDAISGHVLMEGPSAEPLLIMDKVGDGRVGMLMSDQAWLWVKGYDGGGPYSELFRRMAHWLLGEPDLDAEKLKAQIHGDELIIERMTLNDTINTIKVQKPDGSTETLKTEKISDGVYRGTTKITGNGAYILDTGSINTITAVGALNPKEYSDLSPNNDILSQLVKISGGGIHIANATTLPNIKSVQHGAKTSGKDWIGFVKNNQFVTRNSKRTELLPGIIFFALTIAALALSWRLEGQ